MVLYQSKFQDQRLGQLLIIISHLIIVMLLIIFSIIAILGFIVLFKINHQRKIDILVTMVIVMVVANYLNELNNQFRYIDRFEEISHPISILFTNSIYKSHADKHHLLQEQTKIIDYLTAKKSKNQNVMVHFQNLNFERFRLIFHNFQNQNNNVLAAEVSGTQSQSLDIHELKKQIKNSPNNYFCLIVQNFNTFDQLYILKNLYLRSSITIIFRSIPQNFTYHSISDLTQKVRISQNYFFNQMSKTYTPELISKCSKYANINYDFYLKSQNAPLVDVCCRNLPRTTTTNCIRTFMKDQNDFVPIQQIQHCFKDYNDVEGVLLQNGMAKVQKQYYWADRCDPKIFSITQTNEL